MSTISSAPRNANMISIIALVAFLIVGCTADLCDCWNR